MTEEIWKPVVRFGKIIPYYFVSNKGKVKRKGAKKELTKNLEFTDTQGKKRCRRCTVSICLPSPDFFKDCKDYHYSYTKRKDKRKTSSVSISVHRLVMDAFKPIDEYPPIPKEDWNITPETAKKFIKDTVVIDHINDDASDNRVENLRWVSSLQNSNYRKNKEILDSITKKETVLTEYFLERFIL